MLIYLIRHGEAIDDKLTRIGKRQIKYACEYLKGCNIKKIYCSPYNRCIQTADIISKKLNIKYEIEQALKERNLLQNINKNYENSEWYQNYLNPNYSNKELEGGKDYLKRTYKFLKTLKKKKEQDNILLVAHSCTSYAINNCFFNSNSNNMLTWTRMGNGSILCYNINQLK